MDKLNPKSKADLLERTYTQAFVGKGGPAMIKTIAAGLVGVRELAAQVQATLDKIPPVGRLLPEEVVARQATAIRAALDAFGKLDADVGGRIGEAAKNAERIAANNVTISKRERTPEVVQREYLHVIPKLASMSPAGLIGVMLAAAERGDQHGDDILDAIENVSPILFPAFAAIPSDIRAQATDTRQRVQNPAACEARDELKALVESWRLYAQDIRKAFGSDELGRDPLHKLMADHEAQLQAEADANDEALAEAVAADGVE